MRDLNNLFYFIKIVEHGSLSAASEALGVAKSALSLRLARLEKDLGVRLIHRSTRHLRVTEVGARYYRRCCDALAEIERAGNVIDEAYGTPRGSVRLATPFNFTQVFLAPLLADFMVAYPEVEVALDITNREVNLITEGYDLALRITPELRASTLVARSFPMDRHILVASRGFVDTHGLPSHPEDLRALSSVSGLQGFTRDGRYVWQLTCHCGKMFPIPHRPRLFTENIFVIKRAVMHGCGVAELPPVCCRDELASGELVRLLPEWSLPQLCLHMVFPSRQGLTAAVRCFIDYLSQRLGQVLDGANASVLRLGLVPLEEHGSGV